MSEYSPCERGGAERLPDQAPIRVGLAGCGRVAQKHFEALETYSSELQLAAVCDIDPVALERACGRSGAEGYADFADMLRDGGLNAVVLATPSGLHSQQAVAAAAAGLHVVTEKPMATSWAAGKRMVQACDEAGVRLFVVKQNRCNPTLQLLRRAIRAKRFGRIYMVAVNVFWTRPQGYYDSAPWRGTWEFDGGALMNQASHYVDLLDWLIGPVESVQAMTGTLARDIEVEDTAVLNVRWRSGALGSMSVTMLTHRSNYEGSITVLGEKGTVRIGGVAVNRIDTWEFAEPNEDDAQAMAAGYGVESVYGNGHVPYYRNVIDVLHGRAAAETDGREGLRSLELLIASYLSARDGKRVALPLEY